MPMIQAEPLRNATYSWSSALAIPLRVEAGKEAAMNRTMKRLTKPGRRRRASAPHVTRRPAADVLSADAGDLAEMPLGPAIAAVLTGGDLDADWMRAWDAGDEAVGGSTATPDQDIVDEIGRALGVEQESDAEVWTSREILRERDRHRWQQEE
jgi:hypothetical protein